MKFARREAKNCFSFLCRCQTHPDQFHHRCERNVAAHHGLEEFQAVHLDGRGREREVVLPGNGPDATCGFAIDMADRFGACPVHGIFSFRFPAVVLRAAQSATSAEERREQYFTLVVGLASGGNRFNLCRRGYRPSRINRWSGLTGYHHGGLQWVRSGQRQI